MNLSGGAARSLGVVKEEDDVDYRYQPMQSIATESDFALLGALEPLLLHQQSYIDGLEEQAAGLTARVKELEEHQVKQQRAYEREIDKMVSTYKEHIGRYQAQEQDLEHKHTLVDLEREDLSRLSSLLRAEAEALETKNFKLLERIQELE